MRVGRHRLHRAALLGDPLEDLLLALEGEGHEVFTDRSELKEGEPYHEALREALSLAIDRAAITANITRAGQVPAFSLVPMGVRNYTPAQYEWKEFPLEQRIARARAPCTALPHHQ